MALTILIFLGVMFQGVIMFRSGVLYDFGIGYWGPLARDGVWHEALVAQLGRDLPPGNPGFAGEALTNYHYFYDLLVSLIGRLGISANFLIYRFFPVVLSVLLGIGTYKLSQVLFKNKSVSILAVFFAYFGSSFGWIVSLIKGEEIGGESAFWANQPVSMNLNPPFAISLVLLIAIILFFLKYQETGSKKLFWILSLAFGLLIGFKVYAGILVLLALAMLSIESIFVKRNFNLLKLFMVALVISLFTFMSQTVSTKSLIEFKPFWLVDSMIDFYDRVGWIRLSQAREAYLLSGNWVKYLSAEFIALGLFVFGNMGTRIVGIFLAFKVWKKELFKLGKFCLIFWMSIFAFTLPLLFVQKGNPWNMVQFFYYFLYFSSLFTAYAVVKIYAKLPKSISFMVVGLVLVITPISSIATFRSWLYPNPPAYLSRQEYEALKFLKNREDGIVLKHPFDKDLRGKFKDPYPLNVYADNAYVSAYSGKGVFIEDVEQQIILDVDYKSRLIDTNRFFVEKDLSWSKEFLTANKIKYLYLPKIYQLPMAEGEYPMIKIFENDGANIYSVIQER